MKKYIDQIFNEGLGYSLYLPIEKKIKRIKNKKVKDRLYIVFRLTYLLLALIITVLIIIFKK